MRYFILFIIVVGLAAFLYKSYVGGHTLTRVTTVRATEVAGQVRKAGRKVGRGAGKAFRSVDFGGRR